MFACLPLRFAIAFTPVLLFKFMSDVLACVCTGQTPVVGQTGEKLGRSAIARYLRLKYNVVIVMEECISDR